MFSFFFFFFAQKMPIWTRNNDHLLFASFSKVVSKLDYFVTVNGKVLDPKVYTGPTETDFLSRNLPVCACVATSVYYVDVAGSLTWADAQALGEEIIAQGIHRCHII